MLALTPNRAGLGEADRERLLYRWNATGAPVPDLCVHELFERQAAASPEAVAVVHEDRRRRRRVWGWSGSRGGPTGPARPRCRPW